MSCSFSGPLLDLVHVLVLLTLLLVLLPLHALLLLSSFSASP